MKRFSSSTAPGTSSVIGRQWATTHFGQHSYPYIVSLSVGTYWLFVSLVPIYNKYYFDKTLYPYPIATAGIQLGIVSVLLGVYSTIAATRHSSSTTTTSSSWLFGPGLAYKLKWTAPIGMLFGFKYGVTNLGLSLIPAPTHLLLQSTDLVWTCLAAWFLNRERISKIGVCCCVGCVAGSAVLSIHLHKDSASSTKSVAGVSFFVWAFLINLASPILLGLCVTTLRMACTELMKPNNVKLQGGCMGAVELTCLKLVISSLVAICLACMFERGTTTITDGTTAETDQDLFTSHPDNSNNWWIAFGALPRTTQCGVAAGALFILIFQVNCTFLTFLTSAISVGLAGQVKIIPQWIAAAILVPSPNFHLELSNMVGAILTMSSAAAFCIETYYRKNANHWNNAATTNDKSCIAEDVCHCHDDEEQSPLLLASSRRKTCLLWSAGSETSGGHVDSCWSDTEESASPLLSDYGSVESDNGPNKQVEMHV